MRVKYRPTLVEAIGVSIIAVNLAAAVLSSNIDAFLNAPTSEFPYAPPSGCNLLGTNDIRSDVLTDLIASARVSFIVGIASASISTILGTLAGMFSGYRAGLLDEIVGGATDFFLVIPPLPLMIVFAAYLSPSIWNVVLVIGLLWWPGTARIVRAKTMQLRNSLFVEGLIGIGAKEWYIILRHILPNVWDLVAAKFITSIATAILIEAGLSFIGLGDPMQSSWGSMLHFAMTRGGLIYGAWWTFVPPGLCISVLSLAFMLLGMGFESRQRLMTKELVGDN